MRHVPTEESVVFECVCLVYFLIDGSRNVLSLWALPRAQKPNKHFVNFITQLLAMIELLDLGQIVDVVKHLTRERRVDVLIDANLRS